jgi:uncharacterized protein YjhX (UPF0386 family)
MFEYTKQILLKVSFDKVLFRKELLKAIEFMKNDEKHLLKIWCLTTFGHHYHDIIMEVFKKIS